MGGVQQALMMAGSGEVGTSPIDIGGCRYWFDATLAGTMFTDNGTVNVSADTDLIRTAADASAQTALMMFQGISGNRPAYRTGVVNGKSIARFGAVDHFQSGTATATGGGVQSTSSNLSDFISASAATVVCAVKATAVRADQGAWFNNDRIFWAGSSFYFALGVYRSGGLDYFGFVNRDPSTDVAVASHTQDTMVVLGMKHEGGNIKIRANGGSWSTTASGNTDNTGVGIIVGDTGAGGGSTEMDLAHLAFWQTALSDADLLEVEKYLGHTVGITI